MDYETPTNPAARYRAGNGALFTATKCPPLLPEIDDENGGDPESDPLLNDNTCSLPFGFLYTPMAVPDAPIPQAPCIGPGLPPAQCVSCLAYVNLYSSVQDEQNMWYCALCGSKNAATSEMLQDMALVASPMYEFRQPLLAKKGKEAVRKIILVVDAHLPPSEAHEIPRILKAALDGAEPVQIALVVFHQHVSVYQIGLSGMACASVLVDEDDFLTEDDLKTKQYFHLVEKESDDDTTPAAFDQLSLCFAAIFGVNINKENIQPTVDSTTSSEKKLSRLEMLKQKKAERLKRQQQKAKTNSSSPSAQKVSGEDDLQHHSSSISPWMRKHTRHVYRATGKALVTALDLAHEDDSRIFLFTNGCPNHGEGSVVVNNHHQDMVDPLKLARSIEFFSTLADESPNVIADVFCTGPEELAIASYQAWVEPSGGYVLPHESFLHDCALERNLLFIMQQTHSSRAAIVGGIANQSDEDESDKDAALWEGCAIDIRAPPFLTPTHLVGPGELLDDEAKKTNSSKKKYNGSILYNERSAYALGASLAAQKHNIPTHHLPATEFVDSTMTRVIVGRVDPLSTYSIMFRTNDSVGQKTTEEDNYAFFQCIARFVEDDALVTRVSNHRLTIAKNMGEFLDCVDEEVIPVVLGKEAVYRSMYGREMEGYEALDAPSPTQLEGLAFRSQEDLDNTISRISGSYRLWGLSHGTRGMDLTEEGGVRAAGSSVDFAFPPELSVALKRLYHLRRGPLLNPGPMRSLDDRAEIRSLFLRFPMEDCLCMMSPLLWICQPDDANLTEIPAETLALWSNSVIAADNYHTQIIWTGREVMGDPQHDKLSQNCRTLLQQRSQYRFPHPQLHVVSENDSMSRRFTALLAPSHGDPVDYSITSFPALAQLSTEELEAVRRKFVFYDPETDPSFRSWFWDVVGATSKSKEEGVSLIE